MARNTKYFHVRIRKHCNAMTVIYSEHAYLFSFPDSCNLKSISFVMFFQWRTLRSFQMIELRPFCSRNFGI